MEKIASQGEVVEKETSVPHWADAIERRDDEELSKRHRVEAARRRQSGGEPDYWRRVDAQQNDRTYQHDEVHWLMSEVRVRTDEDQFQ